MKIDCDKIENLITPIIEAMGFIVWHIELHRSKQKTLLRIYIDMPLSDKGKSVGVEDCSAISNQISALLDVEMPTLGNYVLEVSSPGLDRSLCKPEHYQKYLGSNVRLILFKPMNERRDFTGKIQEVFNNTLKLLVGDEVMTFDLTNISKAKLILGEKI